jgi:hypothetical protein
MVETLVGSGRCRFALTMAWRIRVSVIATGRGPARGEINVASTHSGDRGHEVSILIVTAVADGR